MEKLWTTAEAARYLGINEIDVEQLVRQGKLIGYRLGGQFLRFRPDQVKTVKDQLRFRPNTGRLTVQTRTSWLHRTRDFLYFYDFYLVSAALLGVVVMYLLISTR